MLREERSIFYQHLRGVNKDFHQADRACTVAFNGDDKAVLFNVTLFNGDDKAVIFNVTPQAGDSLLWFVCVWCRYNSNQTVSPAVFIPSSSTQPSSSNTVGRSITSISSSTYQNPSRPLQVPGSCSQSLSVYLQQQQHSRAVYHFHLLLHLSEPVSTSPSSRQLFTVLICRSVDLFSKPSSPSPISRYNLAYLSVYQYMSSSSNTDENFNLLNLLKPSLQVPCTIQHIVPIYLQQQQHIGVIHHFHLFLNLSEPASPSLSSRQLFSVVICISIAAATKQGCTSLPSPPPLIRTRLALSKFQVAVLRQHHSQMVNLFSEPSAPSSSSRCNLAHLSFFSGKPQLSCIFCPPLAHFCYIRPLDFTGFHLPSLASMF